jgi:hypothetical protein
MASRTARPNAFTLDVPQSWIEFDIWRATRTGDLARLVDRRIKEHPDLAPQRGALLRLLREAAIEAERNDAVYCASMSEVDPEGGALMATVMVFHTRGSFDPRENTVEAIASQVTSRAPVPGSPHWRLVEVVELPAGRAVQVRGVQRVSGSSREADFVTMQTLIPVPTGYGVLNVALSSPQAPLAEPMLELFAAITSTLAWTSEANH